MGSGLAEGAHRLLVGPYSECPESQRRLERQRAVDVPGTALRLTRAPAHIDTEGNRNGQRLVCSLVTDTIREPCWRTREKQEVVASESPGIVRTAAA